MRILYDVSDGADAVSDKLINCKRVSRVFQFSFIPIWYVSWMAIIMHAYVLYNAVQINLNRTLFFPFHDNQPHTHISVRPEQIKNRFIFVCFHHLRISLHCWRFVYFSLHFLLINSCCECGQVSTSKIETVVNVHMKRLYNRMSILDYNLYIN